MLTKSNAVLSTTLRELAAVARERRQAVVTQARYEADWMLSDMEGKTNPSWDERAAHRGKLSALSEELGQLDSLLDRVDVLLKELDA